MSEHIQLDRAVDARRILKAVTATFGPGCHGVVGPNGSGKTTLLRLCAGLTTPSHGSGSAPRVAMSLAASALRFSGETIRDHWTIAAHAYPVPRTPTRISSVSWPSRSWSLRASPPDPTSAR